MLGQKPEPRRLEFLEEMQKKTVADARSMILAVRPITETLMSDSMQSFFRSVQTAVGPLLKMQEQVQKETEWLRAISEPKEYVMPSITYAPPVVRLAQDQFDELVDKVATMASPKNIEVTYDRPSKELYRHAFGTLLSSSFEDTENNKRLMLVEKLIRSGKYVATRDLVEHLDVTDAKQVRNLVQAVNAKVASDLKLTKPFIKGARGSGYQIDRFYSILTVQ